MTETLTRVGRTKVCPRCPDEVGPQPLTAFKRDASRPDQYYSYCLVCSAEYQRQRYRRRKAAEGKTVDEAHSEAVRQAFDDIQIWDAEPRTDAEYLREMERRREANIRLKRQCRNCATPLRLTRPLKDTLCSGCEEKRAG